MTMKVGWRFALWGRSGRQWRSHTWADYLWLIAIVAVYYWCWRNWPVWQRVDSMMGNVVELVDASERRTLGVDANADSGTIKTAYRNLMRKFHPDKNKDCGEKVDCREQVRNIQNAYRALMSNPSGPPVPEVENWLFHIIFLNKLVEAMIVHLGFLNNIVPFLKHVHQLGLGFIMLCMYLYFTAVNVQMSIFDMGIILFSYFKHDHLATAEAVKSFRCVPTLVMVGIPSAIYHAASTYFRSGLIGYATLLEVYVGLVFLTGLTMIYVQFILDSHIQKQVFYLTFTNWFYLIKNIAAIDLFCFTAKIPTAFRYTFLWMVTIVLAQRWIYSNVSANEMKRGEKTVVAVQKKMEKRLKNPPRGKLE